MGEKKSSAPSMSFDLFLSLWLKEKKKKNKTKGQKKEKEISGVVVVFPFFPLQGSSNFPGQSIALKRDRSLFGGSTGVFIGPLPRSQATRWRSILFTRR